jgi:hypothetical protein
MEYHIGIMEYGQGYEFRSVQDCHTKPKNYFQPSHVQITYLFRQPYQEVSDPRYILNILDCNKTDIIQDKLSLTLNILNCNKRVSIIWSQPIHASLKGPNLWTTDVQKTCGHNQPETLLKPFY